MKKNTTRALLVWLAFVLCLSSVPTFAFAETKEQTEIDNTQSTAHNDQETLPANDSSDPLPEQQDDTTGHITPVPYPGNKKAETAPPAPQDDTSAANNSASDTSTILTILEELSADELAIVKHKSSERGLEIPTVIEVLYDWQDTARYVLSESILGYLIYDRQSGIVMQWAECKSPYAGYLNKKYYSGYGIYLTELNGELFDILDQRVVFEVPHIPALDNISADAQTSSQSTQEGLIPLAQHTSKSLSFAEDYIEKFSFGNNAGGDSNSCTAVAIQLALNYLDQTVDGKIVPDKFEAEELLTKTTEFNLSKYAKTGAMFNHLLYDCYLAPVYFAGLTPGVWGDQARTGILLYRAKNGITPIGLNLDWTIIDCWGYVTAEIDKELVALITTSPLDSSRYKSHTMVVTGYDDSYGQRDFKAHNGWYGDGNILKSTGTHVITNINCSQVAIGYRFRFTSGWHTDNSNRVRYFNGDGSYKTGWQTIDNKRYYFDTHGIMQTGWKVIDCCIFQFADDGVLLHNPVMLNFSGGSRLVKFRADCSQTRPISISGSSTANGASLVTWTSSYLPNQRFELIPTGEAYSAAKTYYIINVKSGKALQPASASPASGSVVQQYSFDCSEKQKWLFEVADSHKDATGKLIADSFRIVPKIAPSFVLDVSASADANGAKVILYPRTGNLNQAFRYSNENPTVANGTYSIRTTLLGYRAIDVSAESVLSGADIVLYDTHLKANQRFNLEYNPKTGYYHIRNVNSGLYLDVIGGSLSEGTRVTQWTKNSGFNQQWAIISISNQPGKYFIYSANSGMLLDAKAESGANNTHVIQWPFTGNSNQQWYLGWL
jgi:hypothetical protein